MIVVEHPDNIHSIPSAVTIGTFDGVHLGHRQILSTLISRAVASEIRSVVVTFDPHPQVVLQNPHKPPVQLLSTIDERLALMQDIGVDMVVVIPFTKEFASLSARDFVQQWLLDAIGMTHLVVGHDHMFGRNRDGNKETLQELARVHEFSLERVGAYQCGELTPNSTAIRKALQSHELGTARAMLGRHYEVLGTVVQGDGRGRKIGVPTANVRSKDPHKLLPGRGVYLVQANIHGALTYGMANIGVRPTFTSDAGETLEVHFFDMDQDLYGMELKIKFLNFIRKERKFVSLDQFLARLKEDRKECVNIIENGLFN